MYTKLELYFLRSILGKPRRINNIEALLSLIKVIYLKCIYLYLMLLIVKIPKGGV